MRILQIITSLRIGGAERLVSEISPILKTKGHQVDVLLFDGVNSAFKDRLMASGVKVLTFGTKCNIYNPLIILKLSKLIGRYDLIHTHNSSPQLFTAIAKIISKRKPILFTTEHNTTNRRRNIKLFYFIDKWMYKQYNTIICISDDTQSNLQSYLPCIKGRLTTIHNGINISMFSDAIIEQRSVSDKFVITMVAGFRPQKDQDTLVKAMSLLDPQKFELWLVGDGERRHIIADLIHTLKLDNCVKLLGISNDVPALLKSSDVVVMSSHWEGFGLAAVEAMAAKRPVIASNVPGLSKIVQNAGILFAKGDYKSLAKEINKLYEDKAYYRIISEKCYLRALDFDINIMVDNYYNLYMNAYEQK